MSEVRGQRSEVSHEPSAVVQGSGIDGGDLLLFDELPSTNRWALENVESLSHGDIVRAIRQTAGRGRFNRSWVCPESRGLAISAILKPEDEMDPCLPTRCAAVAIGSCLQAFAIDARLKWPNDVMVNDHKISGVLAETTEDHAAVVLGVGLNVNMESSDFDAASLSATATSMKIAAGTAFDLDTVLFELIRQLDQLVEAASRDPGSLISRWEEHDWLSGHRISITCAKNTHAGIYRGVDAAGRLLLTDDEGNDHAFWSGDIRRV